MVKYRVFARWCMEAIVNEKDMYDVVNNVERIIHDRTVNTYENEIKEVLLEEITIKLEENDSKKSKYRVFTKCCLKAAVYGDNTCDVLDRVRCFIFNPTLSTYLDTEKLWLEEIKIRKQRR